MKISLGEIKNIIVKKAGLGSFRGKIPIFSSSDVDDLFIKKFIKLPKYQKLIADLRNTVCTQKGIINFVTGTDRSNANASHLMGAIIRTAFPPGVVHFISGKWGGDFFERGYNVDALNMTAGEDQHALVPGTDPTEDPYRGQMYDAIYGKNFGPTRNKAVAFLSYFKTKVEEKKQELLAASTAKGSQQESETDKEAREITAINFVMKQLQVTGGGGLLIPSALAWGQNAWNSAPTDHIKINSSIGTRLKMCKGSEYEVSDPSTITKEQQAEQSNLIQRLGATQQEIAQFNQLSPEEKLLAIDVLTLKNNNVEELVNFITKEKQKIRAIEEEILKVLAEKNILINQITRLRQTSKKQDLSRAETNYERLKLKFNSLFDQYEKHVEIVNILLARRFNLKDKVNDTERHGSLFNRKFSPIEIWEKCLEKIKFYFSEGDVKPGEDTNLEKLAKSFWFNNLDAKTRKNMVDEEQVKENNWKQVKTDAASPTTNANKNAYNKAMISASSQIIKEILELIIVLIPSDPNPQVTSYGEITIPKLYSRLVKIAKEIKIKSSPVETDDEGVPKYFLKGSHYNTQINLNEINPATKEKYKSSEITTQPKADPPSYELCKDLFLSDFSNPQWLEIKKKGKVVGPNSMADTLRLISDRVEKSMVHDVLLVDNSEKCGELFTPNIEQATRGLTGRATEEEGEQQRPQYKATPVTSAFLKKFVEEKVHNKKHKNAIVFVSEEKLSFESATSSSDSTEYFLWEDLTLEKNEAEELIKFYEEEQKKIFPYFSRKEVETKTGESIPRFIPVAVARRIATSIVGLPIGNACDLIDNAIKVSRKDEMTGEIDSDKFMDYCQENLSGFLKRIRGLSLVVKKIKKSKKPMTFDVASYIRAGCSKWGQRVNQWKQCCDAYSNYIMNIDSLSQEIDDARCNLEENRDELSEKEIQVLENNIKIWQEQIKLNQVQADNHSSEIPFLLLLSGLPAAGKTVVAEAFANEMGFDLILLDFGSTNQPLVGASEAALREMFSQILKRMNCFVLIDEMDENIGETGGYTVTTGGSVGASHGSKIIGEFKKFLSEKESELRERNIHIIMTTNHPLRIAHAIISRISRGGEAIEVQTDLDVGENVYKILRKASTFLSRVTGEIGQASFEAWQQSAKKIENLPPDILHDMADILAAGLTYQDQNGQNAHYTLDFRGLEGILDKIVKEDAIAIEGNQKWDAFFNDTTFDKQTFKQEYPASWRTWDNNVRIKLGKGASEFSPEEQKKAQEEMKKVPCPAVRGLEINASNMLEVLRNLTADSLTEEGVSGAVITPNTTSAIYKVKETITRATQHPGYDPSAITTEDYLADEYNEIKRRKQLEQEKAKEEKDKAKKPGESGNVPEVAEVADATDATDVTQGFSLEPEKEDVANIAKTDEEGKVNTSTDYYYNFLIKKGILNNKKAQEKPEEVSVNPSSGTITPNKKTEDMVYKRKDVVLDISPGVVILA